MAFVCASTGRYIHPLTPETCCGSLIIIVDFTRHREDNRGKCADNPAGRHPIRTINAPSSIIPPILLPVAILPIYPGLGQAPNMLDCIPGGFLKPVWIYWNETVSDSGMLDRIKSALHPRQTTLPAPHHSVILQAGCPSCHPTNQQCQKQLSYFPWCSTVRSLRPRTGEPGWGHRRSPTNMVTT